ncbi:chromatin assembly complex [Lecanosticta acicola]|uniref:Chromatin assembly complex n=1 Tax=Lecanosticta acicola TaxID=111012 RepID=A0AAI8YZ25_9PEZI|nr:chromatin assembly complex [Lecanosticta acicola]
MEDIVSSPPSPNIRKRQAPEDDCAEKKPINLKGSQFLMPTPPDTDQSSNVSADASINNDEPNRAASPAPSSSALSSVVEATSSNQVQPSDAAGTLSTATASSSGPPPAKKRKLTPLEKLEKSRVREIKEREKAEEKARKEEEKARKEEEKARKEEERQKLKDARDEKKRSKDEETRKKAEEREAKKREKEHEEERKNQEKLKKERSQMRLGAFFQQKPSTPARDADSDEYTARARRRSVSLEHYDDVVDQIKKAASPMKGTPPPPSEKKPVAKKPHLSDYHRFFLPFQLPQHSTMAPLPEFSEAAQEAFDREIQTPSLQEQYDLGIVASYRGWADIEHYFARHRNIKRGIQYPRTRRLVDVIHGTSKQPIDLTNKETAEHSLHLLRELPIRLIQFEEDVRPAYCGTYTKIDTSKLKQKVSRNPFTKARQDTDYEYESEAEWEPPEEGDEDVLCDEEDEADSQADADDEGFLDDEDDDGKNKRKIITGELIPTSTGLCWAGHAGRITIVDGSEVDKQPEELQGMRMGILLPGLTDLAIDPFSTSYWQVTISQAPAAAAGDRITCSSAMAPPRPPLGPRPNANGSSQPTLIGAAEGMKGPITTAGAAPPAKRGPKPAPKTLSKEDMDEFKNAVIGSDVGKLELQKSLKARFPKMTNEVIKETLSLHFAQVGKTKADKRWKFVTDA